MLRLLLLCWALVASGVAAVAAQFTIAPPSPWVDASVTASLDPTPAADLAHGYDYRLLDRQVNVQAAASYDHNVYRITSPGSLGSGARVSWSFDPSYEKLVLHHVRVIRDGVAQERLKAGQVQVIQQENDLDRHMLNGRLTAFILLEDVRVGDVIDYAVTRQGANPVFAGHYMDDFSTGWSIPVRHQRIRLVSPKSRPLFHKEQGVSSLKLATQAAGNDLILTWEGRDLPVIINEGELPSWFTPYPFLQVTDFKSWAAVAAWAVPLYSIPADVPAPVAAKAAELTRGLFTDEAKTTALLGFVQEEIRYLGLELGPGTHRPNPPELVLSRRFGDCKDKTLLFCTLMRAIGLEAVPALVNTSYRDRIEAWMPSPYAFDHVIACVTLEKSSWWVDPTLSYQHGGARYRGLPDYRLALTVQPDTAQLSRIVRPQFAPRHVVVDEYFDIADFTSPARLKIVSRYTGLSADSVRDYLARTSLDEISKDYVNYYASAYPGISSAKPVSWVDQADTNTVTVEETYTVPDLWKPEDNDTILKAEFYPKLISDYATQPSTRVRTMPLGLSHPVQVRLTTHVNLHKDWNVPLSENLVEDGAFRLSSKLVGVGRLVTMTYIWDSLSDNVPSDKITAHVAAITRARTALGYNLTHNKTVAAANAQAAATAAESPRFRFNWMPVVLILATAVALFHFGRYLCARPPLVPPPIPGPGEHALVGISGWLGLVAFGVVLRPIIFGVQLATGFAYPFNLDTWESLTTAGTESYVAWYAPLISMEVVGNTLLFLGSLLLALLFFKRKRAFPGLFIALMLFMLAFNSVDTWAAGQLIKSEPTETVSEWSQITMILIQAAIWIPYMLLSRRVKLTFTR